MPMMPAVRRLVARRPWVQWIVIMAVAIGLAASVADAMARVDAERARWGSAVTVWVAKHDVSPGDLLAVEALEVPVAVRPDGAAGDPNGAVARQDIGRGEIVTEADIVDADGSLAPPGWVVAPVRESLPSGAGLGDRVQVASDGFVIASDARVVGFVDDITLVAAPADVAALLPAASVSTDVALLRSP